MIETGENEPKEPTAKQIINLIKEQYPPKITPPDGVIGALIQLQQTEALKLNNESEDKSH